MSNQYDDRLESILTIVSQTGLLGSKELICCKHALPTITDTIDDMMVYRKKQYFAEEIYNVKNVKNYTEFTNAAYNKFCSQCQVKKTKLLFPFTKTPMCNNCRWNKVISMTRAKSLYNVSDEDLERLDYYTYKLVGYGKYGTLYRKDDVEDISILSNGNLKRNNTNRKPERIDKLNEFIEKISEKANMIIRELYKDIFKGEYQVAVRYLQCGNPCFTIVKREYSKWCKFIKIMTETREETDVLKYEHIPLNEYVTFFEYYKNNILEEQIDIYINQQAQQELRTELLTEELAKYNLHIPEKSEMCDRYIKHDSFSLSRVVETIREMHWFNTQTIYRKMVSDIIQIHMIAFGFCIIADVHQRTKEIILNNILDKTTIPDFILDKYTDDDGNIINSSPIYNSDISNENDEIHNNLDELVAAVVSGNPIPRFVPHVS